MKWKQGVDDVCVLCKTAPESRSHLFFDCLYSSQVWEYLVKGILLSDYTNDWSAIMLIISDEKVEGKKKFCLRYAFQIAVHALWRERNRIRHEEKPMAVATLKKIIDKGIRNKLSILRSGDWKRWGEVLQFWFSTRI